MNEMIMTFVIFIAFMISIALLIVSIYRFGDWLSDVHMYRMGLCVKPPSKLGWLWSIPLALYLLVALVTLLVAAYAIASSIL